MIGLPGRWLVVPLALLSLCGCLSSHSQQFIGGELQGELHWSGEVRLAGDVVVAESARLTIAPGTRIRFLPAIADGLVDHPNFPGSELIVRGEIVAIGRPDAPIVFESIDPHAGPGSWGAVNLEGSPNALFAYCLFRQADSAVHSRDSTVVVRQSLLEHNLVGLRFNNSDIRIEQNLLRNNHAAIRFHFGAPKIEQNLFTDNHVNLFFTSFPRDYLIRANRFGPASKYQVVLGEEVPDDVQLADNFWDADVQRQPEELFYDGRRSSYLGRVRTEPVLTAPPVNSGLTWTP
ncbi:MAG: hypothetical protein RQ723_02655 [Desulfuromonadales bacterium]|nr:hypothetical protein [Desulfuromonadales bacterium]